MLADFVEMYAASIATSGTGSITMSQITAAQIGGGYTGGALPKFSTALGTAARGVKYIIEDVTTGAYERGFGFLNSGGTDVLERTIVRETWNGTTRVSVGATALAFTASAQNIRVRIAPQSDDFLQTLPARPAFASNSLGYVSGHLTTFNGGYNNGPVVFGYETYAPFRWDGSGEIDQLGVYVTTAGTAGTAIKLGMFAMRPDGMPGTCLFHNNANPIPVTATGFAAVSMANTSAGGNVRLPPGWYWWGYCATNNSVSLAQSLSNYVLQSPMGAFNNGQLNGRMYKNGSSYSAGLPADANATGSANYVFLQGGTEELLFVRTKAGA